MKTYTKSNLVSMKSRNTRKKKTLYKPLFPHLKIDGMIQQGAVAPQSLSYAFRTLKVPVQIFSSGKRKAADHT